MDFFKLKKTEKTAFISAIICGLFAYGFTLTHHFLTLDSMWNQYSDQNMISSGRQFLMFACKISSDYDLPWLNGILAIFYLAVNSALLIRLFKVKEQVVACLVAGFTVLFPSVTSTFAYTYTVDGYMLAVFLATISVYVCLNYKWGFIPSFVILGVSIGIYQAYFSYAIVLFLIYFLLLIVTEEVKVKEIITKAVKAVVTIGSSYIFYVVTLKIMLKLEGETLSGYQGTETVGGFSFDNIGIGLKTAFWSFVDFARWGNVLTTTNSMKYAFAGLTVISAALFVYLFIKNKKYRAWYNFLFVAIIVAVMPIAATMVAVISPNTYVHLLIRMPWAAILIFMCLVLEKCDIKIKAIDYARFVGIVCAFIMLFEFAVVANVAALNMNERYEKTYATCVRIVDRLEQTPGYKTGMPVAILGGYPSEENYPKTDITKEDLSGYFGIDGELCVNATEKYAEFMKHFLGVTIVPAGNDAEQAIVAGDEFKAMDNFPFEDSIKCINGVWVVRING